MARTTSLLTALALAAAGLLLSLSATAAPGTASAATSAGSCGGVTVTPASRTVRRGGRVLLEGRACGASAAAAGSEAVQLKIRKGKKWGRLAKAQASADGTFSVCAPVRVPKKVTVARVKATSTSGARGKTTLRVTPKGASSCDSPTEPAPTSGSGSGSNSTGSGSGGTASTPPPPPPPSDPPPPPPSDPPSGSLLREDGATDPDPMPLWNAISAASSSRHQQFASGAHDGGPFRRLTVQDGDDYWGERAELGYNSYQNGLGAPWGTFFLYQEDQRRVTDFWMRLPSNFPIDTSTWQVVMQMKQTAPANNGGGTPVLALEVREGNWVLTQSDSPGPSSLGHEVWRTPATAGQWTHVSFDVTYSPDPSKGKVQVKVDDVDSPTFTTFTQKYETSPASPGLSAGDGIPSHLRMGIYHNQNLPGTHVDFTDVRVSAP